MAGVYCTHVLHCTVHKTDYYLGDVGEVALGVHLVHALLHRDLLDALQGDFLEHAELSVILRPGVNILPKIMSNFYGPRTKLSKYGENAIRNSLF